MVKIERTTKTDLKAKGMSIYDNKIVDDDGEVVDIIAVLNSVYGDAPFDLSVTRSIKEEVDTEEANEVDISEVEAD